jgi:hypothetical protein
MRSFAIAVLIVAVVVPACSNKDEETRRALLELAEQKWADVVELTGADTLWHVAAGVRSRDELYDQFMGELERQMPDEVIRPYSAALARIGLMPDTLDVKDFVVRLYAEQAGGYYDPARDTLYLMLDLPLFFQEGIAAHEITHGLQDHAIDLDSIVTIHDNDDALVAAQSVMEGQATLVMIADPMGIPLVDAGANLDMVRPVLEMQLLSGSPDPEASEDSPVKMDVIRSAPPYFIEHLLFPYLDGGVFVSLVYERDVSDPWAIFSDLPVSTEQIIHPEKYLQTPRDLPTEITAPDFSTLLPGHELRHENTFGELDMLILVGDEAAAGWDGDRMWYFEKPDGSDARLVWLSVWDTVADAAEFAEGYSAFLGADHSDAVVLTDDPFSTTCSEGRYDVRVKRDRVVVLFGFEDAGGIAELALR